MSTALAAGFEQQPVSLPPTRGPWVLAVVSSAARGEIARAAGADEALSVCGFLDAARDLTGGSGVHVVMDPVGAQAHGSMAQPRQTALNFNCWLVGSLRVPTVVLVVTGAAVARLPRRGAAEVLRAGLTRCCYPRVRWRT